MWLLKTYRPSALAAFTLTTPLFGVVATALVIGEPIGWRLAISAVLVAAGVAAATVLGAPAAAPARRRPARPAGLPRERPCAERPPRLARLAKVVAWAAPRRGLAGVTLAGAQALVAPELRQEATRVLGELATIRGLPPPGSAGAGDREPRRASALRRGRVSPEVLPRPPGRRAPSPGGLAPRAGRVRPRRLPGGSPGGAGRRVLRPGPEAAGAGELADPRPPPGRARPTSWSTRSRIAWSASSAFLAGRPGHERRGARPARRWSRARRSPSSTSCASGARVASSAALPDVVEIQNAIRKSATGPVLARAPAYVRAMLLFPYAEGLGFVHAFRQRQPWSALSAIYQDPPRSASQILHPERYLDRREDPVPLELPDLASVLPAGSAEGDRGRAGRVRPRRSAPPLSRRRPPPPAGGGIATRCGTSRPGSPVLISLTAWDTPERAGDFARTYARHPGRQARPPARPERSRPRRGPPGPRAFLIEARGRAVLIVEGAPAASIDALRAAVWARRVLY